MFQVKLYEDFGLGTKLLLRAALNRVPCIGEKIVLLSTEYTVYDLYYDIDVDVYGVTVKYSGK